MAVRYTDAERLERIKAVFPNEQEARSILEYDKAVDATKDSILEYDLPPDKEKTAKKFTRTGTRKAPTVYKWNKTPKKREDATKEGIIAELAKFLETASEFNIQNLQITNKTRQIAFSVGSENFTVTLTRKTKKES